MLVSSQTAVKGGHGFEIAVRMDNLRGWDWGETQNNAHRVWSMHSRSSLFSVVFLCLISPTQTFKLEKSTLNTKEWGKSRFDEILELWFFIFDYFAAPGFCLTPAQAALVCSFRASGKNRRHLGCHNVMRSRGCAVQNKGITLSHYTQLKINQLLERSEPRGSLGRGPLGLLHSPLFFLFYPFFLPFSPTAEPGLRLICIFHYRTILDASKLMPWLRGLEIKESYMHH